MSGVSARDHPAGSAFKSVSRARWATFKPCLSALLDAMAGASFKVCKDQTCGLCAAAKCNVFDGVAYCQCDVKHGDSVSLRFPMGNGEDVCSINAAGADNKYMVAVTACPRKSPRLQGGAAVSPVRATLRRRLRPMRRRLIVPKHRGDDVSRFHKPVPKGQIICSCPITQAKPHTSRRIPNPGALSVRQVILQILQGRHCQQPYGFNDLCWCPDWHSGAPHRLA